MPCGTTCRRHDHDALGDPSTDVLIAGSYYATLTRDALSTLDGYDPDTDALIAAGSTLAALGLDDAPAFVHAA